MNIQNEKPQKIHQDINEKKSNCWLNLMIPVTKIGSPTEFFEKHDSAFKVLSPILKTNSYFYIFSQHLYHRGVGKFLSKKFVSYENA